jgi:hypothetical protein
MPELYLFGRWWILTPRYGAGTNIKLGRTLTSTVRPLTSANIAHSWVLNFFEWHKNAEYHEKNTCCIFKLEISYKNQIIQNESIYVYMKCHRNQSLFKQLSLTLLQFLLIFKVFTCLFSKIHYRTKAVVCQNILKMIVKCTALNPMYCCFYYERGSPGPSHGMTQRVVIVYFLRATTKLSVYYFTCRVIST